MTRDCLSLEDRGILSTVRRYHINLSYCLRHRCSCSATLDPASKPWDAFWCSLFAGFIWPPGFVWGFAVHSSRPSCQVIIVNWLWSLLAETVLWLQAVADPVSARTTQVVACAGLRGIAAEVCVFYLFSEMVSLQVFFESHPAEGAWYGSKSRKKHQDRGRRVWSIPFSSWCRGPSMRGWKLASLAGVVSLFLAWLLRGWWLWSLGSEPGARDVSD